ncbi:hypothetical protein ACFQQB_19235 [Nonomuraea rubra]
MTAWRRCSGSRCLGGATTGTDYYLATANATSTDRRDTIWHWRRELADGRGEHCYTGNSHVKPMLRIIDSSGGSTDGWRSRRRSTGRPRARAPRPTTSGCSS